MMKTARSNLLRDQQNIFCINVPFLNLELSEAVSIAWGHTLITKNRQNKIIISTENNT